MPTFRDLADHVGDSLALAQAAAATDADTIVFCGVHFMAETAKILNPDKLVLLPDLDAGCSLADRCPIDEYSEWLKSYPGHTVINYINSSAAVKAVSDIIVTSSNAVSIVQQLPLGEEIVFGPDRHLGKWVEKQTGREMVLCPASALSMSNSAPGSLRGFGRRTRMPSLSPIPNARKRS